MGQRLLLAITLLLVARLATFISPLPDAFKSADVGGDRPSSTPLSGTHPADSRPSPPIAESTATAESGISDSHSAAPQDWSTSETTDTTLTPDRSEFNPVRDHDGPQVIAPEQRFSATASPAPSAIARICETVRPAVVTVHAGREIGSGSIVQANGLVITNYHVIRDLPDTSVYVVAQDGTRYDGQVIASDRPNDLALIQLNTPYGLPTVRLAATGTPATGQAVCAIGSPFGEAGVITAGRLRRILPNGDLQSDVVLKPGNSGGPLINQQGDMIGVNKGIARRSRRNLSTDEQGRDQEFQNRSTGQRSYATNAAVAHDFIQRNQGLRSRTP